MAGMAGMACMAGMAGMGGADGVIPTMQHLYAVGPEAMHQRSSGAPVFLARVSSWGKGRQCWQLTVGMQTLWKGTHLRRPER